MHVMYWRKESSACPMTFNVCLELSTFLWDKLQPRCQQQRQLVGHDKAISSLLCDGFPTSPSYLSCASKQVRNRMSPNDIEVTTLRCTVGVQVSLSRSTICYLMNLFLKIKGVQRASLIEQQTRSKAVTLAVLILSPSLKS